MLLLNEHVQFPYRALNPSLRIIADGRATITPLRGLYSVFPLLFIKYCVFIANYPRSFQYLILSECRAGKHLDKICIL